jgi:hypothetical protein
MKKLLAIIFLLAGCAAANAWPVLPGVYGGVSSGGGGGGPCAHAVAGYADGCVTAPTTGQIIFPNFFTDVRQSGQPQYKALGGAGSDYPVPWDAPGITYPVGAYTADASLLDPNTTPISGCNTNTATITCSSAGGVINVKHYRFNGIGMSIGGAGGPIYNFEDNHFTATWNNCRNYAGLGLITATNNLTVNSTSNTWDFDNTCAINASLYKQTGDTGQMPTNSNFTGTFTAPGYLSLGSVLLGTGSPGLMARGMYIDYAGRTPGATNATAFQLDWLAKWKGTGHVSGVTFTVDSTDGASPNALPEIGDRLTCGGCGANGTPITAGSAGVYTLVAGPGTIGAGTTLMTALTNCQGSACNNTVWETTKGFTSSGAVASSTGPVEMTANGAIQGAGAINATYNADLGWGQFVNGGDDPQNTHLKYNYGMMLAREGQHINFLVKLPTPGTLPNFIQNFNTIYWSKDAWARAGTGTIDQFTTKASNGTGFTTTTLAESKYNIIIANKTVYGGLNNTTNSLLRFLNQGGSTASGISYSLSAGVLTVSAVTGTLNVNDYVSCQACAAPVQILSFGTGSGGTGTYNVSNSTDSRSLSSQTAYPYPGKTTLMDWSYNYLDATGADTQFTTDFGNAPVGTFINIGNVNLNSGNACFVGSGNCP